MDVNKEWGRGGEGYRRCSLKVSARKHDSGLETDWGTRLQRLAGGTPERGAGARGLFARLDWGGAVAAGLGAALVDEEIFFAVTAAGGAAASGVGDDLVAGVVGDVGLEEFSRGGD